MPFRQQKSAKKGSEKYLMFVPNHILVTLMCHDGPLPGHEIVCRWLLNRYKQLLGPLKLRNCVFEMEFEFSKLVKVIVFRCLRANTTVGCSE